MKRVLLMMFLCLFSTLLWSAPQKEKQEAVADSPVEIRTGVIDPVPITTRFYKDIKAACAHPISKIFYTTAFAVLPNGMKKSEFEKYRTTPYTKKELKTCVIDEAFYALEDHQYYLYVPKSYDGNEPYGLYIHMNPGPNAQTLDAGRQAVMDKYKIIYASPRSVQNMGGLIRHAEVALDVLASIRQSMKIDPKRIYVGGYSGGGRSASQLSWAAPKTFRGIITMVAGLPENYPEKLMKARDNYTVRWATVSGTGDDNYNECKRVSQQWEKTKKFKHIKFFDIPGMGHDFASAETLDLVFDWMENGEKVPPKPNPFKKKEKK